LMPARGRLRDANTVQCDNGTLLRAGHILLATGSSPRRLDVPGDALAGISDDFFQLCEAPARLALVGGGYIAVELAGVLQALGSQVDLYARSPRLLGHADEELAQRLQDNYRHQGIGMHFGYPLAAIEGEAGRLRLRDEGGGTSDAYAQVILAVGRVANTAGIGLERAGIALDDAGNIVVDAFQRS